MTQYPLSITENTLVDYPRLDIITDLLNQVAHLPGSIAEVGVYKGGTAKLICSLTPKHVFLYDTFAGMPPVSSIDLHKEGDFADTSVAHVERLLADHDNFSIHKGLFPASVGSELDFVGFAFVHLDVDIYNSVRDCLTFFTPRMLKGGFIVLDDYNEPNCPGAKLATDEFCAANNLILEPTVQSQAIIRF